MANLNIVTALHCEAKPIIEYFKLKKITHLGLPFSIFVNKDKNIQLIISGIGKVRMAAATTFLHAWSGSQFYTCFLNIGIAGSLEFCLGESILVNKIIENSTQRCWYPFISLLKNRKQTVLTTHDLPQSCYPSKGMIDMEGSAFFQTAACFVSQEQIQLLKIISDNDTYSQQALDERKVTALISSTLNAIIELITYLVNLSQQEQSIPTPLDSIEKFQSNWHFSQAQTIQLKEYLRRWHSQIKDQSVWDFCQQEKKASHVINKIIKRLDSYENSLS